MTVADLDAGYQREVAVGDVIRCTAPPNENYPRAEPFSITGRVWMVTEARAFFRCLTPCRSCAPSRRRFGADQPSHSVWRRWTNWEHRRVAADVRASVPGDAAEPSGEAGAEGDSEYLSSSYPDLWGYGLSRERIRAMAEVPTDGTYV
ncbi:hypothetical protein OHQ89_12670 [Streptomyces canus]|uniref:hypothetical protein n=1 Tax=Streptomyces canus TaxID=58343 RepID=UPI0030DDF8C3